MIYALALTGPTASGKTAVSIEVAKALGCEIISLDSMQIYRGMDIGTAKATSAEQAQVPHHLIDLIPPNESFSAKAYRARALATAGEISERGKIPLFVGGTGLYLTTLIRPECEEVPESRQEYREAVLSSIVTEGDRIRLWERLREVDAESAEMIHYNNIKRVIRALEIYDATGKTKTYFDSLTKRRSDDISIIHVTLDFHSREQLYKRVDKRVDEMMNEGLVEEVIRLKSQGYLDESTTAAQAIGYKEILRALDMGASMNDAAEEIKQASRNYAKRQLTWFRHDADAAHVFRDREDGSLKPLCELKEEILNIFGEIKNAGYTDK